METPEINSEQHYFDLNKEDYDLADEKQIPKKGDQIILQSMALPMNGFDLDAPDMGCLYYYYRGIFVEQNESYCIWNSLSGNSSSPHHMSTVRVVKKEKVWEI